MTATLSSLQGEYGQWLAGAFNNGKAPSDAQKKAYDTATKAYTRGIQEQNIAINTANNELGAYAKPGAYATDSYGLTPLISQPAVSDSTAVTIPAILMQPAKTSQYVTLPVWYTPYDGIVNLGFSWATHFSSNKYKNNFSYPTVDKANFVKYVYLKFAYEYYTSSQVSSYINKLVVASANALTIANNAQQTNPSSGNQTAAAFAKADADAVAAAYTLFLADKNSVVKRYAAQQANITKAKKSIETVTITYVNTLNQLFHGVKPPPSGTSDGNPNSGGKKELGDLLGTDNFPPLYTLPADVEFNLPPHNSSLPLSPTKDSAIKTYDDTLRRGRFFFYADTQATFTQQATKSSDVKGQKGSEGNQGKKYGFQFLWNPETWGTRVSINPDVTPGSPDYWQTSLPVFPSGQELSLQIVLDRVNDFNYFGTDSNSSGSAIDIQALNTGTSNKYYVDNQINNGLQNKILSTADAELLKLRSGYGPNVGKDFNAKILDLATRGTLADIEYLYKTINGAGWTRLGQKTADIGFLMMTLVEVEIGPSRYLGYLNSLNVNHTFFTPNMVPLRSTLDLQFVLMASAKVAQPAPGINSKPGG